MSKIENLIKDLKKASQRLKEMVSLDATRINKDAAIQRFEFSFELAWKTMQEYIRDEGFDCKSPKSCMREAARLGLINNPQKWFNYLKARNLIAHTYNEELADKVYQQALKFPEEVDELLEKLNEIIK